MKGNSWSSVVAGLLRVRGPCTWLHLSIENKTQIRMTHADWDPKDRRHICRPSDWMVPSMCHEELGQ